MLFLALALDTQRKVLLTHLPGPKEQHSTQSHRLPELSQSVGFVGDSFLRYLQYKDVLRSFTSKLEFQEARTTIDVKYKKNTVK